MSDGALNPEENKPVEGQIVELPPAFQGKLPRSAAPAVHELASLSSKDRAQVFKAFNKLPAAQLSQLQVSHTQTFISSPLPPAAELERYEKLAPGTVARLVTMAENQSSHRMGLETKVVESQISQSANGQWFAFALGILGIGAAIVLCIMGYPGVGGTIGGAIIGTLAVSFLIGRSSAKNSRQKKAQGE